MLPLSNSMRANYAAGVDAYYAEHASVDYRNPHFPGIKKTLQTFLNIYMASAGRTSEVTTWNIVDLAAGSGEVSEVLLQWQTDRLEKGLTAPHKINITATDPYTSRAYADRIGTDTCLPLSFADVANGNLPDDPPVFDMVISSFALHLLNESSQLWSLLTTLSRRSKYLVVLAPHKKPAIKDGWNWSRLDPWTLSDMDESAGTREVGGKKGDGWEIYLERVRLRVWRSLILANESTNNATLMDDGHD
ncbi:hypothetical protein EMMF5_000040 [Cystobasidiomycetes sp. EMM_F5]